MRFGSVRPGLLLGTAGFAAAGFMAWLGPAFLPVPDLPLPEWKTEETTATVVSALEGTVTAKRKGRVVAATVGPGEPVAAGDPLFRFEDLPLLASRAELEREIAALRESAAAGGPGGPDGLDRARESAREFRAAALRQLESSHETARTEFRRWEALYEEGLVARVEFERQAAEFSELDRQLQEARAAAAAAAMATGPAEVS